MVFFSLEIFFVAGLEFCGGMMVFGGGGCRDVLAKRLYGETDIYTYKKIFFIRINDKSIDFSAPFRTGVGLGVVRTGRVRTGHGLSVQAHQNEN